MQRVEEVLPCPHNWLSLPVSVSLSPHPSPVSETGNKIQCKQRKKWEHLDPQEVVLHEDINDTVVTVLFRSKKYEITQNTRKGNTFYCCVRQLVKL